jgi:hypothetical protein
MQAGLRWWQAFWIVTAVGLPVAAAQSMRDLMEEVLDQTGPEVRIEDQTLPEAFKTLEQQTGLRMVLDEAAVEAMPYGLRTRISLVIAGIPLRQGLRQTLEGLGLSMKMEDDRIRIVPIAAVERLGRRLALEEVQLLQTLATRRWAELGEEQRAVLLSRVAPEQARLVDETVSRVRAPSALAQLELGLGELGYVWLPDGETIVVYPPEEEVRRRLEREVSLNYQNARLDEVFMDLAERAGVKITFEPGLLARLQASDRRVDLIHRRTTIRQALDRLSAAIGITYQAASDGLHIGASEALQRAASRPAGRIVALLRIPLGAEGISIEFPFYEDDLPAELARLREQKLPEVIHRLRQQADKP